MVQNTSRPSRPSLLCRLILPVLLAAVLVAGCHLLTGSYFIEIEDRYANMILSGAYGQPEASVQNLHPLLGQLLALLYRVLPAINWYGVLLLALVFLAGATAISLAAHRPGGLIPGFLVLSPLMILLTASLQSQVIAALCAVSGTLCLLSGLADGKQGAWRVLFGMILIAFGILLHTVTAWFLIACTLLCMLPGCLREHRTRTMLFSLPFLVLLIGALWGYDALLQQFDPALAAYRTQYAVYDALQEGPLLEEAQHNTRTYGEITTLDGDDVHLDEEEAPTLDKQTALEQSVFHRVAGWTFNDADLFFRRNASDTELTDPATLKALAKEAPILTTDVKLLFESLKTTLKKMQFLLLLVLFLGCALVLQVTHRNRGLLALMATFLALGGHLLMLMLRRTAFCDIAPFYLSGILLLLYRFDPAQAREWWKRVVSSKILRSVIVSLILVCFVVGLGGIVVAMRNYNHAESPSLAAATDISDFMASHPDAVLIGDNPIDRYNTNALEVPQRGSYERMFLGSYDLYSPRMQRFLEKTGMTN
ncbi:MAG: hypothetical protein RR482_04040, partial [Clostridia bacterium]